MVEEYTTLEGLLTGTQSNYAASAALLVEAIRALWSTALSAPSISDVTRRTTLGALDALAASERSLCIGLPLRAVEALRQEVASAPMLPGGNALAVVDDIIRMRQELEAANAAVARRAAQLDEREAALETTALDEATTTHLVVEGRMVSAGEMGSALQQLRELEAKEAQSDRVGGAFDSGTRPSRNRAADEELAAATAMLAEVRLQADLELDALRSELARTEAANIALGRSVEGLTAQLAACGARSAALHAAMDVMRAQAAGASAALAHARNGRSATVARAAQALRDVEGQVLALTAALESVGSVPRGDG